MATKTRKAAPKPKTVLTEAQQLARKTRNKQINAIFKKSTSEVVGDLKLQDDIVKASQNLSRVNVRCLVKMYYMYQKERMRAARQAETSEEAAEPNLTIEWMAYLSKKFEATIKASLLEFVENFAVGKWMMSNYGIGPVLSAGMLSEFDIAQARTCAHFWSFCGLNPKMKWEKGQKRPWNAFLKTLVIFRAGEVMVKFQNRDECFYGQKFKEKKLSLIQQNLDGKFAETAKAAKESYLAKCKASKQTPVKEVVSIWNQGQLLDTHIHARARRWTMQLFVSHLHYVMFTDYYQTEPPIPYIIDQSVNKGIGDHRHYIAPPNWPFPMTGRSLRDF